MDHQTRVEHESRQWNQCGYYYGNLKANEIQKVP